jgi:hypothetical protein
MGSETFPLSVSEFLLNLVPAETVEVQSVHSALHRGFEYPAKCDIFLVQPLTKSIKAGLSGWVVNARRRACIRDGRVWWLFESRSQTRTGI